MTFEQWWEQNEKQYSADACHMSEFHMASVVWAAAVLAERERCAKIADAEAANKPWNDSATCEICEEIAAAIRKGETP